MELWIPIAVAAAFLQNVRSALQKRLRSTLSVWGATAARFVFAAPLAVAVLAVLLATTGVSPPALGGRFLVFAIIGGLAQILATGLLIHLFSRRNFTVATMLTKTEPVQVAVFSIVLLGERVSVGAGAAILVSLVGVILISLPKGRAPGRLLEATTLIGLASGALFGVSATAYRGAALALGDHDTLLLSTTTLAFVTCFQAVVALVWMAAREPGEVARLFHRRRAAGMVGVAGMLASLCWFTAFALEPAAHVRAVGQVEIIFVTAASVLVFKERISPREAAGLALATLGVLGLILLA